MRSILMFITIVVLSIIISLNEGAITKKKGWSKQDDPSYDSSYKPPPYKPAPAECPKGAIFMWFGDLKTIPDGFRVCDGKQNTPDLRDRFPLAAGNKFQFGTKGGRNTITLEPDQIPSHSHALNPKKIQVSNNGIHDHKARGVIKPVEDHKHGAGWLVTKGAGAHNHEIDLQTDKGGHEHKQINLIIENDGVHSHNIDVLTSINGSHSHSDNFYVAKDGSAHDHEIKIWIKPVGDHTHSVNIDTEKEGPHKHGAGTLTTVPKGNHWHKIGEQETAEDGEHEHVFNSFFPATYDTQKDNFDFNVPLLKVDLDNSYEIGVLEEDSAHKHKIPATKTEVAGEHDHPIKGMTAPAGDHLHKVVGDTGPEGKHSHKARADIMKGGDHRHDLKGGIKKNGDHLHIVNGETQTEVHSHEVMGTIGGDDDGEHKHKIWGKTGDVGDHTHDIDGTTDVAGGHKHDIWINIKNDGEHNHKVRGNTENFGDGKEIDITNPFYAVYFICCVGADVQKDYYDDYKPDDKYEDGYGDSYVTDDYKDDGYVPVKKDDSKDDYVPDKYVGGGDKKDDYVPSDDYKDDYKPDHDYDDKDDKTPSYGWSKVSDVKDKGFY